MNEKFNQYLEHIFTNQENFEKIIFEVQTPKDQIDVIHSIASYICNESEQKNTLNFCHLQAFNKLDVSDIAFGVVRILFSEVVEWLSDHFGNEQYIKSVIEKDRLNMYMLHTIGMGYFDNHKDIFFSYIANSFFTLIHQASSFKQITKVAQDAITGTAKHRSLFLLDNGSQIVRRADQVWMRVDQATKAKKRKVFSLTADLKKYKEDLEDTQTRIKALEMAVKLTPNILQQYSAERIRAIFTEDNPQYVFDRRLLSVVPAGDLAYKMESLCEKAAIGAKTPLAREEFKKIQALFTKAKLNNTPKALQLKRNELMQKLPRKKERYLELKTQYQTINDEPLVMFDDTLKKIKDVMVLNLSKRKVEH